MLGRVIDYDDCWVSVPFSNVSAISAQPPVSFALSLMASMDMRTTEPDQLQ